jgi:hypothetical protein
VVWECDVADLPNIQFLVATNGDDRVGILGFGRPRWNAKCLCNFFRYVGIKQTMDGVVLTKFWQPLPVRNYVTVGNKIQIRLQDIPILSAELYQLARSLVQD